MFDSKQVNLNLYSGSLCSNVYSLILWIVVDFCENYCSSANAKKDFQFVLILCQLLSFYVTTVAMCYLDVVL